MSENGEIYTAGKNFTLPPALTAWTNSTSVQKLTPLELNTLVISFILATSPDCPGAIYQRSKWKNSFVLLKEMGLCNYMHV